MSVSVPRVVEPAAAAAAELPETVQSVSVSVPSVVEPAAAAGGRVAGDGAVGERHRAVVVARARRRRPAELPETVQSVSVSVPSLSSPPPSPLAEPPVMVRPESEAVTFVGDLEHPDGVAAADGHAGGRARRSPPGRPSLVRSSVPRLDERVIVCGVAKTVGSNWMMLPSGFGSALAWSMT